MKHFYILFSLILATSFSQLNADILYVKPGATSTAWQNQTNVYSDLQTALADAVAGDEVWVAAGIFKPTNDGDRDISFELQDGVHYYGGFVGDETELSLRDWRENETILSGDIGVEGDNTDNSRQVVTLNEAADVSTEYRTFFDGFIVEDGHGARGGGFYIGDGDPIVRNCWFRENLVSNRGSAIYSGSSDVVEYGNVIFSGNSSKESATVYTYRKGLFYNCLWFNNQADIYSVVHTGTSTTSMYNSLAVNNTNYSGGEVIHRWINLYNTKEYGKGYSSQLLFVDVANYDFRLVEGSEVVDAGDNSNLPDWLSLDFYGNGRIQNDNVDLGPIEGSWQTPRPISPENRSIIEFGISEVEISWGWGGAEPDGVVNYVLEYEIDGGDVLSVSNGLNTSLNLSSLDEGSQVLWKVRAELQSGDFLSAPHQLFVCERSHHLYVTPDGIGNGTSWIDAMSLRDVIDASVYGDSVWVAAGTYKPTDDANRNNSFLFKDGVVLLGGFNGTESSVEERDWLQNQTILSGDIGEEGLSTDNSYNVVTIYEDEFGNGTKDLILDGFVIEDGYNSLNNPGGGGLLLYGAASPLIRNVWFRDNYTNYSGGAVYGGYNSTARFGNVLFTDNSTGYFGGAVYSDGNLEFYNCVWYGNFAGDTGGSVYGEAIIKNSVSWNNYSGSYVDDFTFSAGVTNSIYKTSDFGGNVISENPLFVAPEKNDFRLSRGSPGINVGSIDDVPEWLTVDYFGNERLQDGSVNMGLMEGGVVVPEILSPANQTQFEADVKEIILEWGGAETVPETFVSYTVEYQINDGDPQLVRNIQATSFPLSSISSASVVVWRVCAVDQSGGETWSVTNQFSVLRGHPLFVSVNGTGDGSSWNNAAKLQDAINMSIETDSIWVSRGTYTPTSGSDRDFSFIITEGAKIFGGFAGTETQFSDRNWNLNPTIFSGDIGKVGLNSDNSYHVVIIRGKAMERITDKTVLDGLIIENGYADRWGYDMHGAGLLLEFASPVFTNISFRNNYANSRGSAVYDIRGSQAKFGNVIFTNNTGGYRGIVHSTKLLKFYNCVWYDNYCQSGYALDGTTEVVNSIFWKNHSDYNDDVSFSGNCNILNSRYSGGNGINGNISDDPGFINPDEYDFRLRQGSPLINAGNTEVVSLLLELDYYKNSRIFGDTVDMGISEGGIMVPTLLSPKNDSVLVTDGSDTIWLDWTINDAIDNEPSSYQLEYILNQDTILVDNVAQQSYGLTGIVPLDYVRWRVNYLDDNGFFNWSAWSSFVVSRGHPLFVVPDGTGNGSSWIEGMDLQNALQNAVAGDSLWIAEGTYLPTATTDREISFEIKENIKLFGGFTGKETSFEQRNSSLHHSILSGNIGDMEIDSDNSFHVVKVIGGLLDPVTSNTVVDGVIIENGYADDYPDRNGGGIYLQYASPVVRNVWFRKNYAVTEGGAVYTYGSSQAQFGNVLFTDNYSGSRGGAVYDNNELKFYNCVWFGNEADYSGGALFGYSSVFNSIAFNNSSTFNSNFSRNVQEVNSITGVDPGFMAPEEDDFRLLEGSSALNAGNTDTVPEWMNVDFYGNQRIQGDTIDIGIVEGGAVVPRLVSPANDSVYHIKPSGSVTFEWMVDDDQVAEEISAFKFQYIVREDTTEIGEITSLQYAVEGFMSADSVKWRIGYTQDNGFSNWSRYSLFIVPRDHPLYVVPGGTGNGTSWSDGVDLKGALNMAIAGDSLWISAGTYKPTTDDDRTISFVVRKNIKLFGGFAGDETSFEKRNWRVNPVILSGDIGEAGVNTDNSFHVVDISGSEADPVSFNTLLDGLIIQGGYANDGYSRGDDGGGLYLSYASPIVKNVWFRDNYAKYNGGAVYITYSNGAQFGNVLFADNESGNRGGAVYDYSNSVFYNCVWYENSAGSGGGGVQGNSLVFNSIALKNEANYNTNLGGSVTRFNSIYEYSRSYNGNLDVDPGFVSAEDRDFRIINDSPAINAGNTDTIPAWMTIDFAGDQRVLEDTVDIGLFEGGVIVPQLLSPVHNSYLASDSLTVLLEWGWKDSIPDNTTGFELEYTINSNEPVLIDTLSGFEFLLHGLSPADNVQWRVCSVQESGEKNWSFKNTFITYRDHPLYVKPDGTGNGTSWLSPMSFKDALKMAIRNDEIWIGSGTYKPTTGNDREASFEIKEGIKLYGGFGGFEGSKDERDWFKNRTILSGDIGILDDRTDNVKRVVDIQAGKDSVVVDGLIIENGYADNSGDLDGGGVNIFSEYVIVRNVWFRDNYATNEGGAISVKINSNAYFYNVIFTDNVSQQGGAAYIHSEENIEFWNCLWYDNTATDEGGAIFKRYYSSVKVHNSIAWNNQGSSASDFNFTTGITNSVFADAENSNGNISADPLFVDSDNNIFHLQNGSPAINAGNNQIADQVITDFAGFDRIYGENVDLGPFEHIHIKNMSPLPQGSGTKEFNMLGMLGLTWGITDGTMAPDLNIPDNFDFQLKLWKEGEDENLLQEGPFNPQNGMPGTNNRTHVWELESGNTYVWSIGLDYGSYAVWSEPTTFYIGHDHIIRVKEGSVGSTGRTWADAFGTLTEAFGYALPGDEIWVAAGTYYPVTPADPNSVTQLERNEALSLKPGLLVYGGFAGDESNAWDRNHVENPTILSGDIGVAGDNSDNSVNLIRNEFEASAPLQDGAIIEGFIFEGATGSAIYNIYASPSVEYSIFRNNEGVNGGAVHNENSSPHLYNVLFHNNFASENGGAIYADVNSKPELLSSTVTDNTATITGGLSGVFDVKNSIVYGNENGQFSDGESSVVFTCVEGGYEGEENISYDPMWTDPTNDDYTLQEYSPCIDQGNQLYFTELFSYDLAKQPRTHWMGTDMGAFEVQEIGKLEVVETSISDDSPVDFVDSLVIRFNQPIALDTAVSPVFDPALEFELKVSEEDPTVLIINHPGLQASSDYHLEFPGGQVILANNDKIIQWFVEYDFTTRACIPVALSVENADVGVCPRTSVTLDAEISGDVLDYFWVFNQEDTLNRNVDSLLIDTVMPQNTGEYVLKATDWCSSSDEISLNLQYKSGTELIVPDPKWNTVYFVDNKTGNLSDIKWYLDGVEVSDKQYLDAKSMDVGELTVVAFDEASQCLIYGEVGQIKSASLKSALVSPNPVASGNPVDIVLPEVSEKSRIRLYDMRGAKLIDQEFVESSILQLEDTDFSTGVYLLQIEYNDGFIENKKLIIE